MSLDEVSSKFPVLSRSCLYQLLICAFEPLDIVLPRIGAGKMVKTDWVSFFQQACHVIFWNSLMKPVEKYDDITAVLRFWHNSALTYLTHDVTYQIYPSIGL